jgi:hypothetical protein
MEVSGQLHAPAALPPRKESLIPTGEGAGTQWKFMLHIFLQITTNKKKTGSIHARFWSENLKGRDNVEDLGVNGIR